MRRRGAEARNVKFMSMNVLYITRITVLLYYILGISFIYRSVQNTQSISTRNDMYISLVRDSKVS